MCARAEKTVAAAARGVSSPWAARGSPCTRAKPLHLWTARKHTHIAPGKTNGNARRARVRETGTPLRPSAPATAVSHRDAEQPREHGGVRASTYTPTKRARNVMYWSPSAAGAVRPNRTGSLLHPDTVNGGAAAPFF